MLEYLQAFKISYTVHRFLSTGMCRLLSESPKRIEQILHECVNDSDEVISIINVLSSHGILKVNGDYLELAEEHINQINKININNLESINEWSSHQFYSYGCKLESLTDQMPDNDYSKVSKWISSLDARASEILWPTNEIEKLIDRKCSTKILEIGPGSGAFSRHLVSTFPHSKIDLLDRNYVLEETRKYTNQFSNFSYIAGDIFYTQLPADYDLIISMNTAHLFSLEDIEVFSARIFEYLTNHGSAIIGGFFLDQEKEAALLAQTMWIQKQVAPRQFSELVTAIESSGLILFQHLRIGNTGFSYLIFNKA